MTILSVSDFRPDISDYQSKTSVTALNVLPRGDGFGPFNSFAALTQTLPGVCRGGFVALRSDGSVAIFGATTTRLYLLDNASFAWTDISKGGAAYASLPTSDQWSIKQFGNLVLAAQANVSPQVFDLTSSTAFADLAGSPPQARYIDIVGRFAVLSGLLSNPYRIQWSGLNSVNLSTSWTPGVNSSDYQDFPDGGIVRGVGGGEAGLVLQDQAIRRMTYVPGSPIIFQIERIAQDKGLFAPLSLVRAGERIFFHSTQGFQMVLPGGYPEPIGRERVDRTFLADLDKSALQLFVGASDPRNTRVFWAYKSVSGVTGRFDKIIVYDWTLDRWSMLKITGEFLLPLTQPGLTLEGLDSISSSIDALTTSFDDFQTAITPEIGMFASQKLGFFRGTPLEATVETAEQGTDGKRIFVRGFRPVTDAAAVFGSASARETQQVAASAGVESAINIRTGRCDFRVSTRYSRLRARIPAGIPWSFFGGIEPDIVAEGQR